eukprot:578247-Pyramimonas_sp.AAC.1
MLTAIGGAPWTPPAASAATPSSASTTRTTSTRTPNPLRPRGRRFLTALDARRRRAVEKGLLRPRAGPELDRISVPTAVSHEAKALACATDNARKLELKTGPYRRNGSELCAVASARGHLTPLEELDF